MSEREIEQCAIAFDYYAVNTASLRARERACERGRLESEVNTASLSCMRKREREGELKRRCNQFASCCMLDSPAHVLILACIRQMARSSWLTNLASLQVQREGERRRERER